MNAPIEKLEVQRELAALERLRARGQAGDLAEILHARIDQLDRGHDDEGDDARPPHVLANVLVDYGRCTRDVLHPGDRFDLDVAYRRAAKVGGLALALMRRIRAEKERNSSDG